MKDRKEELRVKKKENWRWTFEKEISIMIKDS